MESKDESHIKFLGLTEMLIDGPYIEELKDLGLTYRGSKNQRLIDVESSMREQKVILERLYREASAC
jgi:anaerobic ribonucleoside-triphosphate reductase activating protein